VSPLAQPPQHLDLEVRCDRGVLAEPDQR